MSQARPSRRSLLGLLGLVLAVGAGSQWWAGRARRDAGVQLAALARPGDIRMLASDTCSVCVAARTWLAEHRVPFTECSIERDAACRATFEASRSPGTPAMLVRGQVLVGFDPQRLVSALQGAGRGS